MTFKEFIKEHPKHRNIDTLYLNHCTLSDLIGIEVYINIRHLYVQNNFITDIEPLKYLTHIETLDLGYNKINNLDALIYLNKLDLLWINTDPSIGGEKLKYYINEIKINRRKRLINLLDK